MQRLNSLTPDAALDRICEHITQPETLNALHACREGHPLGEGNAYKWRNAAAMVAMTPYFETKIQAYQWLADKAIEEGLVL
jgi:hypothetical protein